MGNQQTITEVVLSKIQELEREVLILRQGLFEVAGTQLPKIKSIEFDYKYIVIHSQQRKQMKSVFEEYKTEVKDRIQKIFLIIYQYDIQHNCQYLEEYLAD